MEFRIIDSKRKRQYLPCVSRRSSTSERQACSCTVTTLLELLEKMPIRSSETGSSNSRCCSRNVDTRNCFYNNKKSYKVQGIEMKNTNKTITIKEKIKVWENKHYQVHVLKSNTTRAKIDMECRSRTMYIQNIPRSERMMHAWRYDPNEPYIGQIRCTRCEVVTPWNRRCCLETHNQLVQTSCEPSVITGATHTHTHTKTHAGTTRIDRQHQYSVPVSSKHSKRV